MCVFCKCDPNRNRIVPNWSVTETDGCVPSACAATPLPGCTTIEMVGMISAGGGVGWEKRNTAGDKILVPVPV